MFQHKAYHSPPIQFQQTTTSTAAFALISRLHQEAVKAKKEQDMGEVQFAKQFLTTLDGKSIKYQPDHVFDPKTFETRIPYTLPKLSHPPHPLPPTLNSSLDPTSSSQSIPAPGSLPSAPTVTISLKSARNPQLALSLPNLNPTTTTISSLRETIQSALGGPGTVSSLDKIKLLWNRKPVPAAKKTVSEAVDDASKDGGQEKEIEFGVMVMGGAPDPLPQPPMKSPALETPETAPASASSGAMEGVEQTTPAVGAALQPGSVSGHAVLEQDEFWTDLQGYLEQRIKDTQQAKKVREVFERAWRSNAAKP